jgi:endonuclease/exonuclease/phosphatase (EEP) superfamily protein YafD
MSTPRRPSPLATVVASGFALVGVGLGMLYLDPELQATSTDLAQLSSFIPYGLIPWFLATLVLFLSSRGRGRLFALIPLAGLAAHALVLVPYAGIANDAPPGTEPTLRVISLNLHYGQADTSRLLAEVESVQPDVVVLTEFTSQADSVLTDARWRQLLPYHLGTTGLTSFSPFHGDSSGTQVLSRTPIVELGHTVGTTATNLAVSVETNGHQLVLVAAHPVNPVRGKVSGWLSDADALTAFIQKFADQPVVVVGDLNAVPEHLTIRALTSATGLHDSLAGWQPTYPADRLIPLITIDHVLASPQFSTVSVGRFTVANTDHLGIAVELAQT